MCWAVLLRVLQPSQRFRHPLAPFLGPSFGPVMTALVLLAVALQAALTATNRALLTAEAPWGLLSFTFAGSLIESRSIVESWDAAAQVRAAFNLGIDYLYLLVYGVTVGLACLWVAARAPGVATARVGDAWAWAALAAAACDAVENIALFQLLLGSFWPVWPVVAAGFAGLKLLLLGACILYVVFGYSLHSGARQR